MKIKANFTTKCILRIFGWRVYISKTRMVQKPREKKTARKHARRAVYEGNGHKCMECGMEIPYEDARIHSRLDASHPVEERYAKGNVIMLCPKCNAKYQHLKRNNIWQTSAMHRDLETKRIIPETSEGDVSEEHSLGQRCHGRTQGFQ